MHREAAFAERWVFSEREAVLELHLGFRGVGNVAELDRAAAVPRDADRVAALFAR